MVLLFSVDGGGGGNGGVDTVFVAVDFVAIVGDLYFSFLKKLSLLVLRILVVDAVASCFCVFFSSPSVFVSVSCAWPLLLLLLLFFSA